MNHKRVPAGTLLALALAAAAPQLIAQTAPAPVPAPEDDAAIEMSPFSVSATEDQGYSSKYTLAGTRIRTELKDVGSSVSVYTSQFLDNTGSSNAEQLLVYTTNTEVAGQGGNFLGMGDGSELTATNRSSSLAITRVRGLAEADNTRDFYLSDIPWDSYNVGRIDMQRGPNSILFGIGSPAGIINGSLNAASLKDSNKVENKLDNFGSFRASFDINKVIAKGEFAVRVAGLYDGTKYKQDPAFRTDRRVYSALRWDPKFLKTGNAKTSISANGEKGGIRSNNPRLTPPLDAISPWFQNMGKATYDAKTSQVAAGSNFWLGAPGQRVWDGVVTAFDKTGTQGITYSASLRNWPNTGTTPPSSAVGDNTLKGINAFNNYATRANLPFSDINAYKAISLTDATVFDFYNNLLEGPNKREYNDFEAYNLTVNQSFLNDKLAFNLAYDHQNAKWGYENFLSGDGAVVTVDIMKTLLDGSANPNVGKPMTIAGGGSAGGYWQDRTYEVLRAQAYYDLNFRDFCDKESLVAKLFGRNTLTGLFSRQTADNENRSYNRFYLPSTFAPNAKAGAVGQASRDNIFYMYLGDSLSGASSAAGANLQGVKKFISPATTNINYYNNSTNAWQQVSMSTWNNDTLSDSDKTYRTARKYRQTIDSSVLVWQGFWLDNTVVPMFGWRKDTEKFRDAGNPPSLGDGLIDPQNASWALGATGTNSGISRTYSLVLHLPKSLRAKLPGNLDISPFVNQSENFKPDASRRDIRGNQVSSPQGKTKEFGLAISLLDDRLSLKWTHYKTTVINASVTDQIGGQYLIGAVEAWGQRAAYKFKNEPGTWPASDIYGYSSTGKAVTWRPAGALKKNSEGAFAYTQAELDAAYAKEQASITDWFAHQVPSDFQSAWALTGYSTASYAGDTNYGASGLTVTGDTESKGDEFEIYANPIKGWDVSINLSKTSARRFNLAKSYTDWITERWNLFKGPMGDMRLWGGADDSSADPTHDGETARGKFKRETMAGYNLWNALQNSDVPELRPWHFNIVNNYSFQEGALKGLNVGASYRWQQASTTGFPVISDASGVHVYDIKHPYKGKSDDAVDLWIGYKKRITSKIDWRVQLNVRNLFANKDLIPVTVQPDGSPGAFRIPEPRGITLTNTFEF